MATSLRKTLKEYACRTTIRKRTKQDATNGPVLRRRTPGQPSQQALHEIDPFLTKDLKTAQRTSLFEIYFWRHATIKKPSLAVSPLLRAYRIYRNIRPIAMYKKYDMYTNYRCWLWRYGGIFLPLTCKSNYVNICNLFSNMPLMSTYKIIMLICNSTCQIIMLTCDKLCCRST